MKYLQSVLSFSVFIQSAVIRHCSSNASGRACFGAGCYWGTEKFLKSDFGIKIFPGKGLIKSGQVGFMGPKHANPNPTYNEVCSGKTGYVEVYDFEFEGNYEDVVRHFFMFHDPTTLNQQGNDRGTQYASVIYVYNDEQNRIAHKVKRQLQDYLTRSEQTLPFGTFSSALNYKEKSIKTAITNATTFYPATQDHQAYLDKNPGGYCNHRYRFTEWPTSPALSP